MKTGRDADASGLYVSECCLTGSHVGRRADVSTMPNLLRAHRLGIRPRWEISRAAVAKS
jgi:hypothetical protein